MKKLLLGLVLLIALCAALPAFRGIEPKNFKVGQDVLSLHYDHAPDQDDGQSAAADRTILQSMFGVDWIKTHVLVVSGAYGKNAGKFNTNSDVVMNAVWNECGGWLAGHTNHEGVLKEMTRRWREVLNAGGDVWVKEGGQSDLTAEVVRRIRNRFPDLDTGKQIHVVQHSIWNENKTTGSALAYTKKYTHYIKIRDANAYLNIKGGNDAFVKAACEHPVFGNIWQAAFTYYSPEERLDFSDTGALMYILGLGEIDFDDFRKRFL